jgi:uncharacterized membrane protein YkvA (DUF1232 family)
MDERIEIDLTRRERRLYDRLRRRISRADPGDGSGLWDLLFLGPDFVVLLARLVRDPQVSIGAKLVAGFGVAYAVSPIDLLPEVVFGPFGMVDDLVVLAAALSRIINHVHPDVVRSHWSGRGDALLAIRRLARWAESTVGSTLSKLLGFRAVKPS